MGFFQDLKEDLSLAVNELLPNDEKPDEQADAIQKAQSLRKAGKKVILEDQDV